MLLATSLNVFYDPDLAISPEEGIERCARAGFGGLDFNFCDYSRQMLDQVVGCLDAGAYARSLRSHAHKLGLEFVQMHAPFASSDDLYLGRVEPQTALSHESLRWAAELGVPWSVFHPHTVPGPFDGEHLEELKQRNVAVFRDLLRTAEEVGVGIAIENMADAGGGHALNRRYYCSVPAELIDLVDALNHPLVGICWDTGHALRQRLDQGRALRALGHRLRATHIQDNDGVDDQHLLPYYGQADWRAVVSALRAINYTGSFCYEAHNSILVLPDELRDAMLRYAVHLGRHLLSL
jgi:sugar phosphate isomerase/epimerase